MDTKPASAYEAHVSIAGAGKVIETTPADLLPPAKMLEPIALEGQLPPDAKPEEREWALRVLSKNAG